MNATTRQTLRMANALANAGFGIPAIEIDTADGRRWQIDTVPAGRGRRDDGSWGEMAGRPGGYRLFEVNRNTGELDEHDAIEDDVWYIDDLRDYLRGVGAKRA